MNKKAPRLGSAAVIAAAGMYLLIVLLNSMRPVIASGIFLIPGQFLYLCFMEAAFYLPLLFLISSFLLIADYYSTRIFIAKLLSLLPFFTFSLLLRILSYTPGSPAADFIIGNLGGRGGSMVLGLLLIIEILVMARVLTSRRKTPAAKKTMFIEKTAVKNEAGRRIENNIENIAEYEKEINPDEDAEVSEDADEPEYSFEPVPLEFDEEAVEIILDDSSEAELIEEAEPEIEEIGFEDQDPEEEEEEEEEEETDSEPESGLQLPEDIGTDGQQIVEFLDPDPEAGNITEKAASPARLPEQEENFPDAPVRGDEDEITQAARAVWADAEELGFSELPPDAAEMNDSPSGIEADDQDAYEADEVPESDLRIDMFSGDVLLEIPNAEDIPDAVDAPDITAEPSVDAVAEVIADLNKTENVEEIEEFEDIEDLEEFEVFDDFKEVALESEIAAKADVVDIDPVLSSPAPIETAVRAVSPVKRMRNGKYSVPVDEILEYYDGNDYWVIDEETKAAAEILRETLEEFKIAAEVTGISKGPVITMFEILPAPGVKLSKIVNLADNIALRLAASRVRIVAPIPGKHAVGIEVPNKERAIVSFKEIIESNDLKKSRMTIPVILGKDITGGARIIDLVQTPHLLIAGATGSGKSVCVNSLICSILYARAPEEVRIILIDPKIVELKMYNDIPHLLTPVITEPKKAFQALQYCTCEMERRYSLLNALGVRDIKSYNRKVRDAQLATDTLPYIVIVVDEFADLMATTGKELENVISRLAAMSRAVGIHLVLATQRPSVDVITGLIKANIPSRIAFMVASKTDSRIILDNMGADKLLGKGDMLFTSAWDPNLVRMQGAFLSDDEVERVTDHVKTLGEPDYIDDEIFISEDENGNFELESSGAGDPLMEAAVSIVVEAGKASASYLQRRLKIGYNRAARLVEEMEDRGIVGPANGSKPRDIMHIPDRVSVS